MLRQLPSVRGLRKYAVRDYVKIRVFRRFTGLRFNKDWVINVVMY